MIVFLINYFIYLFSPLIITSSVSFGKEEIPASSWLVVRAEHQETSRANISCSLARCPSWPPLSTVECLRTKSHKNPRSPVGLCPGVLRWAMSGPASSSKSGIQCKSLGCGEGETIRLGQSVRQPGDLNERYNGILMPVYQVWVWSEGQQVISLA